jgi:hypothetical protein
MKHCRGKDARASENRRPVLPQTPFIALPFEAFAHFVVYFRYWAELGNLSLE